jgi:hypothetical protein
VPNPVGGLERANTTLNVSTDVRERIVGLSKGPNSMNRSNTMAPNRTPPRSTSASPIQTGPTRGLMIKKTSVSSSSSGNSRGGGPEPMKGKHPNSFIYTHAN